MPPYRTTDAMESDGMDTKYYIRWMIRRDMPEVLEIENGCFEFPWSEEGFIRGLRARNCIGMVAEYDEKVVGYMIYELHKTRLHVINFAAHPELHRQGVGCAMARNLISKLRHDRRWRMLLEVRESNLAAQQFFRAMGFMATNILRDFYDDTSEDAYQMEYRVVTKGLGLESYGQRFCMAPVGEERGK